MPDLFSGISSGALRRLADAFRTGRIDADFTAFPLAKAADPPQALIDAVLRLKADGMSPAHQALLLDAYAVAAESRAGHVDAELVWTGPETGVARSRDTAVVVRELFGAARHDVIISTFVVHQAAAVFRPLADRMNDVSELRVRLFLHVGRGRHDTMLDSELLRQFADKLGHEWPSGRRPEVYYDPRGLLDDGDRRATWHAKCVVVDEDLAFVTSANFTGVGAGTKRRGWRRDQEQRIRSANSASVRVLDRRKSREATSGVLTAVTSSKYHLRLTMACRATGKS